MAASLFAPLVLFQRFFILPMPELTPTVLLAIVLAVAVVGVFLGLWLSSLFTSSAQSARVGRAMEGEREAEEMLRQAGYTVVARQAPGHWSIEVDGAPVKVSVRADLIVERDGRRFVAEVKTGERAPDPRLPATRRQLLEYSVVFGAREVLLVDVGAGVIHTVGFSTAMKGRWLT